MIVLHLFVYQKQFLFCYFQPKICKFGIFSISKYFCSWVTFLIIFSNTNLFQTILKKFSQQIFLFCIFLLRYVPYEPNTTLEPHVSWPPELTLGEAVGGFRHCPYRLIANGWHWETNWTNFLSEHIQKRPVINLKIPPKTDHTK